SVMCGHQLPILSCLIPLYMVKVMCSWRQTLGIWPVLAVGGGSFAAFQYTFATLHSWAPGLPAVWMLTDVGGGIFSLVALALFLKFVWRPKDEWKFPPEQFGLGQTPEPVKPTDPHVTDAEEQVASLFKGGTGMAERKLPLTVRRVALAWSPFVIMSLWLVVAGVLAGRE